jgi:pimeloyl-ACP methyl ester carboxylesterase
MSIDATPGRGSGPRSAVGPDALAAAVAVVPAPDGAAPSLVFSQHGWADNNRKMLAFGLAVAPPGAEVVAPDLGFVRTWLRFEPLVELVEAEAAGFFDQLPDATARIVGHSMGGLIWLTILDRRPEWRERVAALVLIGCPVRGADLAGIVDRQGWTIGRDLAVDRSATASRVAAAVPTISVAGDLILASDGAITCRSARVDGARFVCLPRESHPGLIKSDRVVRLVRAYLQDPNPPDTDLRPVVARLRSVPGMADLPLGTPAAAGAAGAAVALLFRDGANIRLRHPAFGNVQVAVADGEGRCLWAGATGRAHVRALRHALEAIEGDSAVSVA